MSDSESRLPAFHLRLIRRSIEQSLMRLRDRTADLDDAEDVVGFLLLALLLHEKTRQKGGKESERAPSADALARAFLAAAPALVQQNRQNFSAGALDRIVIGAAAAFDVVAAASKDAILAALEEIEKTSREAMLSRFRIEKARVR